MLKGGVSVNDVSRLLGRKSTKVTEKYYMTLVENSEDALEARLFLRVWPREGRYVRVARCALYHTLNCANESPSVRGTPTPTCAMYEHSCGSGVGPSSATTKVTSSCV
jgi:hypothetical protein